MVKRSLFVLLILAMGIVLSLASQAEATKQKTIVSALAFVASPGSTHTAQSASEICGNGFYHAPLNVPPGATINAVTFYVVDNNSSSNICMQLDVSTPSNGAQALQYGLVCTQGHSNSIRTISLPNVSSVPIDSNSAAALEINIGSYDLNFLCVYGAKVTYTP